MHTNAIYVIAIYLLLKIYTLNVLFTSELPAYSSLVIMYFPCVWKLPVRLQVESNQRFQAPLSNARHVKSNSMQNLVGQNNVAGQDII